MFHSAGALRAALLAFTVGFIPGPAVAADLSSSVLTMGPAWARELPPVSRNGAVYLQVKNPGTMPVRLVAANSPVAERVEIHAHQMDGTMLRMVHLEDGVVVPGGGAVQFAPGGMHLMLIGLREPPRAGTTFTLTLAFEDGGRREVTVEVLSMADAAGRE